MHTKREHYLSIFKVWLWDCSSLVESKLGSVSKREREEEKSWVTVALMSLICVHGLALFMSTTFSAFFFRTCWLPFRFMHFCNCIMKTSENEQKTQKKNFWCVQNIMPQCNCKPK